MQVQYGQLPDWVKQSQTQVEQPALLSPIFSSPETALRRFFWVMLKLRLTSMPTIVSAVKVFKKGTLGQPG